MTDEVQLQPVVGVDHAAPPADPIIRISRQFTARLWEIVAHVDKDCGTCNGTAFFRNAGHPQMCGCGAGRLRRKLEAQQRAARFERHATHSQKNNANRIARIDVEIGRLQPTLDGRVTRHNEACQALAEANTVAQDAADQATAALAQMVDHEARLVKTLDGLLAEVNRRSVDLQNVREGLAKRAATASVSKAAADASRLALHNERMAFVARNQDLEKRIEDLKARRARLVAESEATS